MFRTHPVFLLIAAASFLASNAHAQTPTPAPKVVPISVAYGDLDLDKPADARILYSRLEEASKRACGPKPSQHPLYGVIPEGLKQAYKECRALALGDAVARLDAPLVSRIYAESHQIKPNDVANR